MVAIFTDFSIAAALILFSQLLRSKIKLFQKLFIPASLLAGFIALFLGDQFLGVLSWSEFSGDYTWVLVVLVFASVGLPGIKFTKVEGERIGSYFFYKLATFALQFSIPVIVTCLVLSKINLGVDDRFGLLLAAGFMGGHGTAAAVGATFEKLGFAAATDKLRHVPFGITKKSHRHVQTHKKISRKGPHRNAPKQHLQYWKILPLNQSKDPKKQKNG